MKWNALDKIVSSLPSETIIKFIMFTETLRVLDFNSLSSNNLTSNFLPNNIRLYRNQRPENDIYNVNITIYWYKELVITRVSWSISSKPSVYWQCTNIYRGIEYTSTTRYLTNTCY